MNHIFFVNYVLNVPGCIYVYICCCVYFLRWANSRFSTLSELIISFCEGEGLGAGVFHGFPRHEDIVRPGAIFIFCIRFKTFLHQLLYAQVFIVCFVNTPITAYAHRGNPESRRLKLASALRLLPWHIPPVPFLLYIYHKLP